MAVKKHFSQEFKKLKSKADEAFIKQKWKKALGFYQELMDKTQFDPRICQKVAEVSTKVGNNEKALILYKRLADHYADEGYWAKAIAMGKIMVEMDPKQHEFQEYLSKCYSDEIEQKRQTEEQIVELTEEEQIGEDITSTLGSPVHQIKEIPLFSELNSSEIYSILEKLQIRKFKEGELICKEGEIGKSMYLISEGIVEVNTKDKIGARIVLARLSGGDFFGEYGLLVQQPRSANVQAKTDTELMEINRMDLDVISNKYPKVWNVLEDYLKYRLIETMVKKSEVFSELNDIEIKKLSESATEKSWTANDVIEKEGTGGNQMYFIKKGTLSVLTEENGNRVEIAELQAGDYFGEISFLTGAPRTATIKAKTDSSLYIFEKDKVMNTLKQNKNFLQKISTEAKSRYKEKKDVLQAYQEAKMSLQIV